MPPLATTSGTAQQKAADGKRDDTPEERRGESAADAIEQHPGEQGQREHGVLRAESDGERRQQRAQHDHPPRRGRHVRRHPAIAAVARPLPPPRERQRGLRGEGRRQSGSVAHRPHGEIPGQRTRSASAVAAMAPASSRARAPGARRGRTVRLPCARSTSTTTCDTAAESRSPRRSATGRPASAPRSADSDARPLKGRAAATPSCRARCRPDSRADAAGVSRRRSRGRRARS